MVRGGALIISTARRAVPRGNPQGILKELRNSSALGGSSAPWGIPKSTWYRRFPDTTTIVRKMKSLDSILTLRPGWPFTVKDLSATTLRSEEHTSELQSQSNIVCRLLLVKKKKQD